MLAAVLASRAFCLVACLASLLGGCVLERHPILGRDTRDAGPRADAGGGTTDAELGDDPEAGSDVDAAIDAGAPLDAGPIPDTGLDREADARIDDDAGIDPAPDAGGDASLDGGCRDAPFCVGDVRHACIAGAPVSTECTLGCSATAECRIVVPSNVAGSVSFDDGSRAIDIPSDELWVFDPDDGSIEARDFDPPFVFLREVRDAGAGDIDGIHYREVGGYGVFVIGSLRVRARAMLAGDPTTARPLVILSAGDVDVEGEVRVSSDAIFVGSGGRPGGGGGDDGEGDGGGRAGLSRPNDDGGGGGGSHASSGGPGGDSPTANGGAEGATYGTPELVPLRGGSGGGGGGGVQGGAGGHGGGALQITSAGTITIAAGGLVDASGGGGRGGRGTGTGDGGGGGGGGSGGAILIEAITVEIAGRIGANGGAGGQGATCDDCGESGIPGADGSPGSAPAEGSGSSSRGGGGGDGSDPRGVAQAGADAENGGGGGGGAGRIRINTATGAETYSTLLPTIASGLASVGTVGRSH
jgi:hypothetical protein